MNCEPGDLAVIVRTRICPEAIGRVIRVTYLYDKTCWAYEGPPMIFPRGQVIGVEDACLRPLRDKPGTDETLIYAGLPRAKETA